jgi:hypothetical protein
VELEGAGGHWSRLQLTWSSPHGTMYMFTSPTNGQATSMTRRGFEKLWTTRHIRLVAAQSVVDDALDTVMDTALKNSVRDVDGTEPGDMLPPVG